MISVAALAALSETGASIVICDNRHMPVSLTLPIASHSRHSSIVEKQLHAPKPLRKQLWQAIVKAKINNQANCLEFLGMDSCDLRKCARDVRSGDPKNIEAQAARKYFQAIENEGTRREGAHTAALNYGYAVIRAGIARELVAGGWLVSHGIHHKSAMNAFNLADDLIEPFRPCVDLLVFGLDISNEPGPQAKHSIVSVFEKPIAINGRTLMVQTAISEMVHTFKQAIMTEKSTTLATPTLINFLRE